MILDIQIKEILDKLLDAKIFPGYAASVVTLEGTTVFFGGSQTYDLTSSEISDNTLYDVASLTKIICPMMVMSRMIDTGKVGIDDKIATYLPEFTTDEYKKEATIRHLLTYTLDYDLPEGAKSLMKDISPRELSSRMLHLPLKVYPGTNYRYSNITAFILTQLIEKITGEDFYTLVRKEVFIPLGMSAATFTPEQVQFANIPPTETTEDRGEVRGFVHDESTHYLQTEGIRSGAAGLFATIDDIAKFLSMVVARGGINNSSFVSKEIVKEWTINQFPDILPKLTPLCWGDLNNEMIIGHSNRFVVKGGFTGCFVIVDLEKQIGFAVLSNATYPTRPNDRIEFNKMKEEVLALFLSQ